MKTLLVIPNEGNMNFYKEIVKKDTKTILQNALTTAQEELEENKAQKNDQLTVSLLKI